MIQGSLKLITNEARTGLIVLRHDPDNSSRPAGIHKPPCGSAQNAVPTAVP